jgi:hypothetical protein
MQTRSKSKISVERRQERGAALITTLLISMLLLAAGGMLLLTTANTGVNTFDSSAELQAYYGAEAGVQATLNVLRGNVLPSPLFVANPPGTVAPENRIDFRKAFTPATSNLSTDPTSANFKGRLSRWLPYDFIPAGGSYAERLGLSEDYNPANGIAYSVSLQDPDTTPSTRPLLRLIVESTGYGPRGAQKKLYLMVSANGLDITIPAPLVLRGHDNLATNIHVDLGEGASKTYSGVDLAGFDTTKPSIAINAQDVDTLKAAYDSKPDTVIDPKFAILDLPNDSHPAGVKPPWFLRTANDARAFLVQSEALANSCAAPPNPVGSPCVKRGVVLSSLSGTAGTDAVPQFTIVKGDCDLTGGAGLLIVTGNLTLNGNPNFSGLILVLGQGWVHKKGGGNGNTTGAMMIAKFAETGGFLEPTFLVDGGGTSKHQYDSRATANAMVMSGPSVLGIAER